MRVTIPTDTATVLRALAAEVARIQATPDESPVWFFGAPTAQLRARLKELAAESERVGPLAILVTEPTTSAFLGDLGKDLPFHGNVLTERAATLAWTTRLIRAHLIARGADPDA